MEKNAEHYDRITEAWPYMLGKNFHWGYFQADTDELEVAQINLIEEMIKLGGIKPSAHLVDIGCGIGTPAFYLHKKLNLRVLGISNSVKGVERARERSRELGCSEEVSFEVRDALQTGLEGELADHAWLMEMAHLVPDKKQLLLESRRLTKEGGTVVLCDLMLRRKLSAREIVQYRSELLRMEQAFGRAELKPISYYEAMMAEVGLENVVVSDISDQVGATASFWRENAKRNSRIIEKLLPRECIEDFLFSCDFLERLYREEIWGYAILAGCKK